MTVKHTSVCSMCSSFPAFSVHLGRQKHTGPGSANSGRHACLHRRGRILRDRVLLGAADVRARILARQFLHVVGVVALSDAG